MTGWRGVISGALALVVLEVFVTSGGFGAGAFQWPAAVAERFLDPTVPAIPDHSAGAPNAGRPSAPGSHAGSPAAGLSPNLIHQTPNGRQIQ